MRLKKELEALVRKWRDEADKVTPTSEHNRGVILALRSCAFDLEWTLRGMR